LGSWVIVMLIVRGVIQYKIVMSTFRKQRELARQEIGRLEARIDEVQRKPGDKNQIRQSHSDGSLRDQRSARLAAHFARRDGPWTLDVRDGRRQGRTGGQGADRP